jgi:hypothetical protein
MNGDFYKLVTKLNSLTEDTPKEEKKLDNGKSVLTEDSAKLNEKYMGWKKTVAAIKKGGSAENPEAVAASIGRKKYGKEKFQKAAAAGRKLGEQGVAEGSDQVYKVIAVDKSNALGGKEEMTVKADSIEDLFSRLSANDWYPLEINGVEVIAGKRLKQGVAEGYPKHQDTKNRIKHQDIKNQIITLYLKGMSDDEIAATLKIDSEVVSQVINDYEFVADTTGEFPWRKQGVAEDTTVMVDPKQATGTAIKPPTLQPELKLPEPKQSQPMVKPNTTVTGTPEQPVNEKAPPGAKAERMVKHIKAGYAKDGKLTDVERRKAYGAAWKAHNADKVEEAIFNMFKKGYTKEQVYESLIKTLKEGYSPGSTFFLVPDGGRPTMYSNEADALKALSDLRKTRTNGIIRLNNPMSGKIIHGGPTSTDADNIQKYRASRDAIAADAMEKELAQRREISQKKGSIAAQLRAAAELDQLDAGRRAFPTDVLATSGWKPNPDAEIAPARNMSDTLGYGKRPWYSKMASNLPIMSRARRTSGAYPGGMGYNRMTENKKYKTVNQLIAEAFGEGDDLSLEEKDLKSYIGDKLFNELQKAIAGEGDLSDDLIDMLFDYYNQKGELPPEIINNELTVKDWLTNKAKSILKNKMQSDNVEKQAEMPDQAPTVKEASDTRKVSGRRYGGSLQQDDEDDEDDDGKKKPAADVKRGRGRPPKAGSQSSNPEEKRKQKDREEAGKALQSMIVGNQPKKSSKGINKLPVTKHKMKG